MLKSIHFFKKSGLICLLIAVLLLICSRYASAQLMSADLTLPATNTMSDGKGYYLASRDTGGGKTYDFDVTAINPAGAVQADYDYFRITIPTSGGDLVINWDTDASGEGTYIELAAAATTIVTLNPYPPTEVSGKFLKSPPLL